MVSCLSLWTSPSKIGVNGCMYPILWAFSDNLKTSVKNSDIVTSQLSDVFWQPSYVWLIAVNITDLIYIPHHLGRAMDLLLDCYTETTVFCVSGVIVKQGQCNLGFCVMKFCLLCPCYYLFSFILVISKHELEKSYKYINISSLWCLKCDNCVNHHKIMKFTSSHAISNIHIDLHIYMI